MRADPKLWMRKAHRWGAALIAAPFLIVAVSGVVLQLKKEWSWVQPPTLRGEAGRPTASFDAILDAVRGVPETGVRDWNDVDRLDVRPDRSLVKVQAKNRYEVQVCLVTGRVLQTAYRRSDLLESLHDGSWFHERAKLAVFLPCGVVMFGLWASGLYLFILPYAVKRGRRRRERARSA
jgi:uncharacterized iron-regulated membrane protein